MKYELINPSDKIFFEADTKEIAFLCSLFLGNGKYSARNVETDESTNMYFFGIEDETLTKELGMHVDLFCKENAKEINKCFKSFYVEGERSSMNDICAYAHGLSVKENSNG